MSDIPYRTFSEFLEAKAASARTVNGSLNTFIDAEITIPAGTRERVSTSQNHLRDFIAGERFRDKYFPRILTKVDCDFLGGSFARHVKIWPCDDIDVYFPLDGVGLVYSKGSVVQSVDVLSDGVLATNPLCDDPARWMNGSSISSKKLIAGFTKVLSREYSLSPRVRSVGEAVRIQLATGATKEFDGLGFDIVPCFSMKNQYGSKDSFYLIPDGNDGWITTNPRIDQELSDRVQSKNNSVVRPAIKLVKWWSRERFGDKLPSYYVELAILRAVESHTGPYGSLVSISEATSLAFQAVFTAIILGDQEPLVVGAPKVKGVNLDDSGKATLLAAASSALGAHLLEGKGSESEAIDKWGEIFGDKFPKSA